MNLTRSIQYNSKLTTFEKATAEIKSGDNLFISGNASSPNDLLQYIAKRKDELKNVSVYHLLLLGKNPLAVEGMENHIRISSFFVGASERAMIQAGRGDYTPIFLSEIPKLFLDKIIPINIAYLMVSPPDDHGYMSLGVECVASKSALEVAEKVIVQVNENMPRTHGNTFINVSEVYKIIEHTAPLQELDCPAPTDEEKRIASFISPLINDESTLQLGIGGIPNAVLTSLEGKKNLGIHTEMISDGLLDAIEKGIVTNMKKNFRHKKAVATFALGSRQLYEFLNDNPIFEFFPCDWTNNPFTIAKNDNMISINSALQIDVTGQVCAESLGTNIYSGFGGQLDFVRGANASKGGKSIIALQSTAKNGTISRIVPQHLIGSGVLTTRGDVRFVVTEYGVINLFGKNLRQRAEALINIAHPKFRDDLINEVKQVYKFF